MSVTTSQQIAQYLERFSTLEVTFNKQVVKATLLNTKQVYLKCTGYQWPCIIHTASMSLARIIANVSNELNEALDKANNVVSLRYSFTSSQSGTPLAFFVPAKVVSSKPYTETQPSIRFLTLQYTQRPPDDLIYILGQLIEANINARRRKEERIPLTAHSQKQLGLVVEDCSVHVDGVPRRAIIRDLSFSGCKAVIMGIPKMVVHRHASVHLVFDDPEESYAIPGDVARFDPVEGREDVAVFGIRFEDDKVPISYKMRINAVLRSIRNTTR
jgi:hypothetical protein